MPLSTARVRNLALMLTTATLAAGCGYADEAGAEGTAERFERALSREDGRAACSLLSARAIAMLEESSGEACSAAVVDELADAEGPPDVQVFGDGAMARFDGDVLFLARFADGWRVVAAGCRPRGSAPYDCAVSGG